MAAYNIAVSYEMRNNFDEAIEWAKLSKERFKEVKSWKIGELVKKMADDYIEVLNVRKEDSVKLNEQLGAGL